MTHHPEYTLILPPTCPTNRDHLIYTMEFLPTCVSFSINKVYRSVL